MLTAAPGAVKARRRRTTHPTRPRSACYPDAVAEAYAQCQEIFDRAVAALAVGKPCRDFQAMTLDYFESKGHPTMRTHPGGLHGYVHSL